MGVVVTVFHEACQGQLKDLRCVAVHDAARVGEGLDQFERQHHVTHPQPRIEGFAEGAEINRALVFVQALHACGRQPVVVELAVIVVLNDPLAMLDRPVDQLESTFQRQGCPGGVLMRRRHIDARGAAAVCPQQVRAYAQCIDVNGHDLGLCRFKGLPGTVVARVFQQDRFAGVH
ncbi:hypothetical protein D3C84_903610 [compost metagenome]